MNLTKNVPVVPSSTTHEKKADTSALETVAMADGVQFTANENHKETLFVPQVSNSNNIVFYGLD